MIEKVIDELSALLKSVDAFEGYSKKIFDENSCNRTEVTCWLHLCREKSVREAINQYLKIDSFLKKYIDIKDYSLSEVLFQFSFDIWAVKNKYNFGLESKAFLVIDEENFDFHSVENTGLLEICKDSDIHIAYTTDNIHFYDFVDLKKYCLYKMSCYGQCDDAASWDEVYMEEIN